MFKSKIVFLLLITSTSAFATVYESINQNGVITFSDTPIPNSTQITIHQGNIANTDSSAAPTQADSQQASNAATATNSSSGSTIPSAAETYSSISITSPANQATFQNQYTINVNVEVKPALRDGDKVQLTVDGKPYGQPQSTLSFTVENLIRGTHTVQAVIIGGNQTRQNVSSSITFYIHQPSQLLKAV